MDNRQAYNQWSMQYDSVVNKTRDLEAKAIRQVLMGNTGGRLLEIGCGTGKNTEWLATWASQLVGVDFSEEMVEKAKQKIQQEQVSFEWMDIRNEWRFEAGSFDLVSCSLVLEHIENLDFIFGQAARVLRGNGKFYIGELHPFKQYQGSKARFETGDGIFELECFLHHISDFFVSALKNGFSCLLLEEWFDDDDRNGSPRLISFLFQKTG